MHEPERVEDRPRQERVPDRIEDHVSQFWEARHGEIFFHLFLQTINLGLTTASNAAVKKSLITHRARPDLDLRCFRELKDRFVPKYFDQHLPDLCPRQNGVNIGPIAKVRKGVHKINGGFIHDPLAAKILIICSADHRYNHRDGFIEYLLTQIQSVRDAEVVVHHQIDWLHKNGYLKKDFTPENRRFEESWFIDPLAEYFDRFVAKREFEPSGLLSAVGAEPISCPALVDEERSAVKMTLIQYLSDLISRCSKVPKFFPEHLRAKDSEYLWLDRMVNVSPRPFLRRWTDEPLDSSPLPWAEVFLKPEFRQMVIFGDAGSGKSSLLWHEARGIARGALNKLQEGEVVDSLLTVPLLLRFPELADILEPDHTLVDVILAALQLEGQTEVLQKCVWDLIKEGKVTIMLDGWDEVSASPTIGRGRNNRDLLRRKVEQFSQRYRGRLLVTSRPGLYSDRLWSELNEVTLQPLDEDQVEAFACLWFGSELNVVSSFISTRAVRSLATTPLLLSLLCRINANLPHNFYTEGQIFKNLLEGLLFEWRIEDKHQDIDMIERHVRVSQLASAAWRLQMRSDFTDLELLDALQMDTLNRPVEARALIKELIEIGILAEMAAASRRRFAHRAFQEYLTAVGLTLQAEAYELIRTFARREECFNLVLLAGEIFGAPYDLAIDVIADSYGQDINAQKLAVEIASRLAVDAFFAELQLQYLKVEGGRSQWAESKARYHKMKASCPKEDLPRYARHILGSTGQR